MKALSEISRSTSVHVHVHDHDHVHFVEMWDCGGGDRRREDVECTVTDDVLQYQGGGAEEYEMFLVLVHLQG